MALKHKVYRSVIQYIELFKSANNRLPTEAELLKAMNDASHSERMGQTNSFMIDKESYEKGMITDPNNRLYKNFDSELDFELIGPTDEERTYYLSNQWMNNKGQVEHIVDLYPWGFSQPDHSNSSEEDIDEDYEDEDYYEENPSVEIEKHGVMPFGDDLRRINISETLGIDNRSRTDTVQYDCEVKIEEMIPGLVDFIDGEIEAIIAWARELEICWGNDLPIQVILSPLHKTRTYSRPFNKNDILRLIKKYDGYGINAVPSDALKKVLIGRSFTDSIGGECYASDRCIYIYYRVLDTTSTYDYIADVRMTLAHEMMHMFHYFAARGTFNDKGVIAERVKEALADFFSVTYCLNDNTNQWDNDVYLASERKARERYNLWIERFDFGWPYSYAYFFMRVKGTDMLYSNKIDKYRSFGCFFKFHDVLECSSVSMGDAYSKLIDANKSSVPTRKALNRNELWYQVNKNSSDLQEFIAMPMELHQKLNEDERENYFEKVDLNRKESLAPIYINEILLSNKDRRMTANEILRIITEYPYALETKLNAVRRILNTIAANSENIHRIEDGHDFYYVFSDTVPDGYVTEDDLIE